MNYIFHKINETFHRTDAKFGIYIHIMTKLKMLKQSRDLFPNKNISRDVENFSHRE